jgi:glucose/mannose transport system substrate-binding protein
MRSSYRLTNALLLSLLCPTVVACSDSGTTEDRGPVLEDSLEIYSWWTGSGEAEALQALIDVYSEKHPGVQVTNAAALDSTNARTELADRLEAGEPPDSFQAISGVDLLAHVNDSQMEPITDLAERNGWLDVFPAAVLDTLRVADELYAVPVNIERDNNLYFNKAVLSDHGIDAPQTLDEFYAMCETLQTADPPVDPLALPPAGWVLALVAFETLMPGVNGGDYYLRFFEGNAQLAEGSPDRTELEELFTEFYKVAQCSNIDKGTATDPSYPRWDLHGDKVFDGDAASIVMGDWMKGYLEGGKTWEGDSRSAWVANDEFGVVPGLGSAGHFTFNSAVFGLPKGAPHPNAAGAFLEIVTSEAGQVAFNPLKGSVPARTDVGLGDFDDMVRTAAEDFQAAGAEEGKLLPGYASLTTLEFQLAINPALVVFAVGGSKAATMLNTPDAEVVTSAEEDVAAGDVDYIVQKIVANYERINL